MAGNEFLTAFIRRSYGGYFAIVVDCTNPREISWLKTSDVLPTWARQAGPKSGAPSLVHWDSRHRAHWFLHEVPPDTTLPDDTGVMWNHSPQWKEDWRQRITVHDVFWDLLGALGERGWHLVDGRVVLPDLVNQETWSEEVYRVPEVYMLERAMPARRPPRPS